MSTSPVSCCCATAVTRPYSSKLSSLSTAVTAPAAGARVRVSLMTILRGLWPSLHYKRHGPTGIADRAALAAAAVSSAGTARPAPAPAVGRPPPPPSNRHPPRPGPDDPSATNTSPPPPRGE